MIRTNTMDILDIIDIVGRISIVAVAVAVAATVEPMNAEGLLTCSLVVLSISNCLSSALQNCRLPDVFAVLF